MSRGIQWQGGKNLVEAVEKFKDSYIDAVKAIVAETATIIQTQAQALAPVDEGNLRKSIDLTFENGGLKANIIVGAEYAIYVNYGTGIYSITGNGRKTPWTYYSEKLNRYVTTEGMRAQMFWEPAVEAGMKYFVREMNKLAG